MVLRIPDRWSVPILLSLQQPQTNVPELPFAALNFSQTGAGLKIQLDLLLGKDLLAGGLQREILRALILELSYRAYSSLSAGEPYSAPPDWLVDGILNFNSERDAVGYLTLHSLPLKNLLNVRPALLDSQSRTIYRAGAAVLVQALVEREPAALAHYIADLPKAGGDAVTFFQTHFSWLKGEEAEPWWRSTVARVAAAQSFSLLGFAATSEQFDELRKTTVAHLEKDSLTLEQAVHSYRAKIDRAAAADLGKRFLILSARAHPLLRPVVAQYQIAAESLARKRRGGLAKRLAESNELRRQLSARMQAVDDFMNWFEATQAKAPSGDFSGYARAAEQSEGIVRRRDAISVYLDAMEMQF